MRMISSLLVALLLAAPATADDTEGKGILDFANPPGSLAQCRLVGLDGENVVGDPGRSSWWVEPGDHEITVTCQVDVYGGRESPLFSGHKPKSERQSSPGTTVITVEAGKRYMIAAQVKDETGGRNDRLQWAMYRVDLADCLSGLDTYNAQVVVDAIAHAAGIHFAGYDR